MQVTGLSREAFAHIEKHVYSYHDYKQKINQKRNDIIHGQGEQDENIGAGSNSVRKPSQPTEKIGISLIADNKLNHYETMNQAIDKAYRLLNEDQQLVVATKYWSGRQLTMGGVATNCNMHRNTVSKYRKEFVYLVAYFLGWD